MKQEITLNFTSLFKYIICETLVLAKAWKKQVNKKESLKSNPCKQCELELIFDKLTKKYNEVQVIFLVKNARKLWIATYKTKGIPVQSFYPVQVLAKDVTYS